MIAMSDRQNQLIDALSEAVIAGDQDKSQDLAGELLRIGAEPLRILTEGLTKGLTVVGEKFGSGEMFLTELMLAAEAMKSGLKVVEPELKRSKVEREYTGTIVIGTVEGDIHDIGKTIVSTMLEVNGFRVYDLGTDVKTESFMEKVAQLRPNLLGLSALLSTTMGKQGEVIKSLNARGLSKNVKVLIGGAPVSPEWAHEIGADGYAPDAIAAVDIAKRLVA
jgi:corrinoid protein of di/trimethylamine methyltransferase